MNVETILARLKHVRRDRDRWMALCPAHADRNPSLSIRELGGKILLHCFAGCSIEAICQALRIKLSDLFSEPGASRHREPRIMHDARERIAGLRSRVTPSDRQRTVIVVLAGEKGLDAAIARALALAVEGELVQVAFDREAQ